MKPKYFNPNWRAIMGAINSGNDGIHELRLAQKEFEKKIQDRINAYYKGKRLEALMQKINELKSIPAGTDVYYIGRYDYGDIKFGSHFTKISDKYVNMVVMADNGKRWRIKYTELSKDPVTEQQMKDHKLGRDLSRMVNKVFSI